MNNFQKTILFLDEKNYKEIRQSEIISQSDEKRDVTEKDNSREEMIGTNEQSIEKNENIEFNRNNESQLMFVVFLHKQKYFGVLLFEKPKIAIIFSSHPEMGLNVDLQERVRKLVEYNYECDQLFIEFDAHFQDSQLYLRILYLKMKNLVLETAGEESDFELQDNSIDSQLAKTNFGLNCKIIDL